MTRRLWRASRPHAAGLFVFVIGSAFIVALSSGALAGGSPGTTSTTNTSGSTAETGKVCANHSDKQCATAKTTAAAARCPNCNAFKGLMALVKDGKARMTTYDVEHGVMVQVTAVRKANVQDVHAAFQGWRAVVEGVPAKGQPQHICDYCVERMTHLRQVAQDWALTDNGATVVLTSNDSEQVKWLQQDGRSQQQLVSRAVSD